MGFGFGLALMPGLGLAVPLKLITSVGGLVGESGSAAPVEKVGESPLPETGVGSVKADEEMAPRRGGGKERRRDGDN